MTEKLETEPNHRPWQMLLIPVLLVLSTLLFYGFTPILQILSAAYGWVAHQFFEVPQLAAIRQPTQLILLRYHLAIWMALLALYFAINGRISIEFRRFFQVMLLAWAIRATCWIIGGNLPLVPGDSCHYIETANSVAMGLPSSKHYVESFFRDYPPIRAGRPVLDDWATPLYADLLGLLFQLTGAGIGPQKNLEFAFGLAKGLSFFLNLLTLPCLYFYVRRCISKPSALPTMAIAAILPVHAIYAGFELRESLVGLTSVIAVWLAHEMLRAKTQRNSIIIAIFAGAFAGLAILSRNTAMALVACLGLWLLWNGGRRLLPASILWGALCILMITPWAWLTYKEYGKPFYSYTEHFAHTFSWTVHHYAKGLPDVRQFYSAQNLPEVFRVKIKSSLILFGYSAMILSPPLVFGFYFRLRYAANREGRKSDQLAFSLFLIFAIATLARIADVTQVAQLGRYYMPVYLLMLPTAVRGFQEMQLTEILNRPGMRKLAAASLLGCLWADPTWAYDASWFVRPFQLHWPALVDAGQFVQNHPEEVPESARLMSWFPWEMRVTSNRITVLMPRSYDARRIREVMAQYGVTHIVWGSFEIPSHVDPESFGPYLTGVKTSLGLIDSSRVYQSASGSGKLYPVSIYRRTGP
jgi:hypothetical protein